MTTTAQTAPRLLSTTDVCTLAGATFRQLDSWTRRGYIKPTHRAEGTGSARAWSPAAARHVVLTAALTGAGVTPAAAARMARALIRRGRTTLAPHVELVWDEYGTDPQVGPDPRACIACGCTEENACPDGCAWADPTVPICTRCVGAPGGEPQ